VSTKPVLIASAKVHAERRQGRRKTMRKRERDQKEEWDYREKEKERNRPPTKPMPIDSA